MTTVYSLGRAITRLAGAVLCAVLLVGMAQAQQEPASASASASTSDAVVAPEAELPVCRLDPHDSNKLAVEPCRPAPQVAPRRAVAQVIGHMPTRMPPPVMHFQGLPPTPAVPMPSAPIPIGACDLGGCRDASGARYNGPGNATLNAQGHICQRNGAFIQCF